MVRRLTFCIGIVFAIGVSSVGSATAQSEAELKSAAKELIVAMRGADQFKALLPTVLGALKPVIVQGRPEVERDYDGIQRQVSDAFLGRISDIFDSIAIVYARHFTLAELRALAEFMRGPIGQKFVEKNPVVTQEAMLVGQKFGERIAVELREKMIEELRKRGHKI
jgi:uncharacterized protein